MSQIITTLPCGLQGVFSLRRETATRRARGVEKQWEDMGIDALNSDLRSDPNLLHVLLEGLGTICKVAEDNMGKFQDRLISHHLRNVVRISWDVYCGDVLKAKKSFRDLVRTLWTSLDECCGLSLARSTGISEGSTSKGIKKARKRIKQRQAKHTPGASTAEKHIREVELGSLCSTESTPASMPRQAKRIRLISRPICDNTGDNAALVTEKTITISGVAILPLPDGDITLPPNNRSATVRDYGPIYTSRKRGKNHRATIMTGSVNRDSLPKLPGIPSSKFARVMRLVADLPPIPHSRSTSKSISPMRPPPVWAESRQELCEALPYYRAFQSGLYMSRRIAYGYLLEAFPAPRDIWAHGGRVVISHGGGQCIQTMNINGEKGSPALSADQSPSDARVDTLLHACEAHIPVILIAGEGYGFLPWKLGCAYVILGWYWISYTWVEAEPVAKGISPPKDRDYFHRVKIRFDWADSQGTPWWLQGDANTVPIPEAGPSEIMSAPERLTTKVAMSIVRLSSKSTTVVAHGLLTPPDIPLDLPDLCSTSPHNIDAQTSLVSTPRKLPGERVLSSPVPINSSLTEAISECFPESAKCPSCYALTPKVYVEGWICLKPACGQFWLLATDIVLVPIVPGFSLTYSDAFLQPVRAPPAVLHVPYDVRPPLPYTGEEDEADSVGLRTLWKGWVCDECGRANCRYRWEVWECRNCGKQVAHLHHRYLIVAERLVSDHMSFLGDVQLDDKSGISMTVIRIDSPPGIVCRFELPEGSGRIYHFKPDCTLPADKVFRDYKLEAATTSEPLFQRRALKSGTVKGQLLAQHFAVNSGANYKYNVDTLSLTFGESPACVRQALEMITEGVESIIGEHFGFNEVLSVLYREGQKMSWHDDGEDGLGPVVASLSLGSSAIMSWRPKKGRVQPNSPYYQGEKREKTVTNHDTALSITLSHGDTVIMQGHELQERYSHRVIPEGFRVAATARVITS